MNLLTDYKSINDICSMSGLSRTVIHNLLADGELAHIKVRKQYFIFPDAWGDFLKRNTVGTEEKAKELNG